MYPVIDPHKTHHLHFFSCAGHTLQSVDLRVYDCNGRCVQTLACLWYYVGSVNQDEEGTAPGEQGWVERYWGLSCEAQEALALEPPAPAASVEVDAECLEPDRTTRYVTSIYWAMTTVSTVGYGDITAQTDIEKVASAMTMLFGALVFAGITGQMTSRFVAGKGAVQIFNTRMDEIRQYLRDKSIASQQRRQIEAHFSLLWGKAAIYDEAEILALLPRTLRDPVVATIYIPLLMHVAAFSALGHTSKGREVLALISAELKSTVSMARNIVMQEGDCASVSVSCCFLQPLTVLSDSSHWAMHCVLQTATRCTSYKTVRWRSTNTIALLPRHEMAHTQTFVVVLVCGSGAWVRGAFLESGRF
jgi:hypothetical protein